MLTGWRDPFVLERPCSASGNPWWYVMVGAGVKGTCGTALVYRSKDLRSGEPLPIAGILASTSSLLRPPCTLLCVLVARLLPLQVAASALPEACLN